MNVILDDSIKMSGTNHQFIDELQFQVNQMLADETQTHFIAVTSLGEIELNRIEDNIYVTRKRQD